MVRLTRVRESERETHEMSYFNSIREGSASGKQNWGLRDALKYIFNWISCEK